MLVFILIAAAAVLAIRVIGEYLQRRHGYKCASVFIVCALLLTFLPSFIGMSRLERTVVGKADIVGKCSHNVIMYYDQDKDRYFILTSNPLDITKLFERCYLEQDVVDKYIIN